ncbi:hypothetical protein Q1695_015761 [Nippostrongylus brasiliensis]|nr:hypothetical protein Q1695_015761 [Nippostrongylus brasiliensis]
MSLDADEVELEKEIKQVLRGEEHTFCERFYGFEDFCPIEPITSAPAVTVPNKELVDELMTICHYLEPSFRRYPYYHLKQTQTLVKVCDAAKN